MTINNKPLISPNCYRSSQYATALETLRNGSFLRSLNNYVQGVDRKKELSQSFDLSLCCTGLLLLENNHKKRVSISVINLFPSIKT